MAQELTVRRKHLKRKFKLIPGKLVEISHIKNVGRANRARAIFFYDDNTGETLVLRARES